MLMGQVVGNIVSTRKHESLVGSKILEVKLLHENKDIDEFMIAIACGVGAGICDRVLITTCSSARVSLRGK